MLKTLWKEWKDSPASHNILFQFPRKCPIFSYILGVTSLNEYDFSSPEGVYAFTFLMMSLTVSRRCWSFFISRSMVFRE